MDNRQAEVSSLSKKELRRLQNMYEENDIKMYFQGQPAVLDQMNHQTSKHFADKIVSGVDVLISMGELGVSQTKKKVEDLMDQTQIREEESKALELKAKKQYIQQQLLYLKNQTSLTTSNSEERIKNSRLVLSKQEHKKLVSKLKKDRTERQQHHLEYIAKLERERQQAEEIQKKSQQQSKKEELRRRRELIELNLEKNKKNHEQFLRIEHQSKQKLKHIQRKQFVYQQIQENYQKTIVLPNLEEKKKKLKELRQYKSFHAEQLNEHQKHYLANQKMQQSRRSQVKQQWHYRPPPKSQRLEIILEEERLDKIQKLQQKKKQLEDRISRQDNYVSYLREHFHPKIDPSKEEELKLRIQKSRVSKPQERDSREIGIGYLQQAKKMKKMMKSIEERPQTERNQTNFTSRTLKDTERDTKPRSVTTNYLTIDRNRDEHFYEEVRRKRLAKLSKEEGISESDRIKQLKIETDKINEKMSQKEREAKHTKDHKLKQQSLDLLLSSIQAKIGIIQMYQ